MRVLALSALAGIAGGGAYVGGAFEQGEYYDRPPAEIAGRLYDMRLPSEVTSASDDHRGFRLAIQSGNAELVQWKLYMGSVPFADVSANLAPSGEGTRVSVNFVLRPNEGLMGMEDDPFVTEIAEIAMTEQIDATIEGRPFDNSAVTAKMASAVAADPGAVVRMQKDLHSNVAAELERQAPSDEFGPPSDSEFYDSPSHSSNEESGGWGEDAAF